MILVKNLDMLLGFVGLSDDAVVERPRGYISDKNK
jgi:hypothetical protein